MNKIYENYQKQKRPIKIMQFGEGNFLRAFVEWIIQKTNTLGLIDSNIVVVQPLLEGRVEALKEQNGLYTLILEGLQGGVPVRDQSIIEVLDDFINPYVDYQAYINYATDEDLRLVISNTTEAGIILDEQDTELSACPSSYPGKLLALLFKRYEHFNGDLTKGLIFMPCELIDYNGTKLKEVLVELARCCKLSKDFIQWLEKANYFCNTLVDRIVTGYPGSKAKEIQEKVGYTDHSIVVGEIFHLWVIEAPSEVREEFPFDKAGLQVLYVDDVTPYKERKVRILNGAHTAMVPVAYLYGYDTVRESLEDPVVGQFVRTLIFDEILPTIKLTKEEKEKFARDVIERFLNPYVDHALLSIALNATTKFKTRLQDSFLDYVHIEKKLPKMILFALASQLVFFKGVRDEEDIPLNDNQEFLDLYKQQWATYDNTQTSIDGIVKEYLGYKSHWGIDYNEIEDVHRSVSTMVAMILNKGMRQAIVEVLG